MSRGLYPIVRSSAPGIPDAAAAAARISGGVICLISVPALRGMTFEGQTVTVSGTAKRAGYEGAGIRTQERLAKARLILRVGVTVANRLMAFSDAFVESQNRRAGEFREERLLGLVRTTTDLSAREELNRIPGPVDGPAGKAPRYDDQALPASTFPRRSPCGIHSEVQRQ